MTPPHGTSARYHHGPDHDDQPGRGCHCTACRAAHAERQRQRRATINTSDYTPPIDAAIVRAHLAQLLAAGDNLKAVAHRADVAYTTILDITLGRRATTRAPIAARILATQARPPLAPAVGPIRRAHALARIGYPLRGQARALGLSRGAYENAVAGRTRGWTWDLYHRQKALYDRLAWIPAPNSRHARQSARYATHAGWPSPAGWFDIDMDDATARPVLGVAHPRRGERDQEPDVVSVELALKGRLRWGALSQPEKDELIRTLLDRHLSTTAIARRLGLSGTTITAAVKRIRAEPNDPHELEHASAA